MDQFIYANLMMADPILTIKTGLRFFHFIGLALGLGAATMLDIMLVRFFIRKTISRDSWEIFHFLTMVVNLGLIVLWLTGLGFIVYYAMFDPVNLINDKMWAKLAIVWLLSANGILIHAIILPRIKMQIGRSLFTGAGQLRRSAFLTAGAVSATSWYFPVALGTFTQLNFSVPAMTILATYSMVLILAIAAIHAVIALIDPSETRDALPRIGRPAVNFNA